MPFIRETEARSILTPVSGFLADAGFTHSLTPARNCTFACTYCYVPTMRVQGGLKPEDWHRWGQFTTFKSNAAQLLAKSLRSHQAIYCSPLVDPYQPAEAERQLMPAILEATIASPPRAFVIQTRGPLILRDLPLLRKLRARVSFSITTDRDDVRRIFEPHCSPIEERWRVVAALRDAGILVSVALAPLLPCNPEALVQLAAEHSDGPIIADPLHVRAVKQSGATTREAAHAICHRHGWNEWLDPVFQNEVLMRLGTRAKQLNRDFGHGPAGFGLLIR